MSSIPMTSTSNLPWHFDQAKQHRGLSRLRRAVEALIRSHRAIHVIGPNRAIDELAFVVGLTVDQYCQFEVRVGERIFGLVCVPSRSWNDLEVIDCLLDLKSAAEDAGLELLFLPEAFFRDAHPAQCRWIAGAGTRISAADRMNVLLALLDQRSITIGDLASAIPNADPVSAILHLVALGALEVDLMAPIVMSSCVCLPTLGHAP